MVIVKELPNSVYEIRTADFSPKTACQKSTCPGRALNRTLKHVVFFWERFFRKDESFFLKI